MNADMMNRHMQSITHPSAVEMYNNLCAACEMREGGMTDPDQMLVADIARAEQIKQALLDDIAARGIGQERSNGRQRYWQENKSVAQVRAYAEQQRKHLSELRLTPNSRKAAPVMVDDEFADF
jgi:hypothetical protein